MNFVLISRFSCLRVPEGVLPTFISGHGGVGDPVTLEAPLLRPFLSPAPCSVPVPGRRVLPCAAHAAKAAAWFTCCIQGHISHRKLVISRAPCIITIRLEERENTQALLRKRRFLSTLLGAFSYGYIERILH